VPIRKPSDNGKPMNEDPWRAARESLCDEIRAETRLTASYLGVEAFSEAVMRAMATVPRHLFVPSGLRELAYENRPLPIGQGQTISQPYIVAAMTDLARVDEGARVLEVGTGCGYQAAVLAEIGCEVYSIERFESLTLQAKENLQQAGYPQVHVKAGDGAKGWPEAAPFDAVLVTAAVAGGVPAALIEQLAPGGRIVIPLEERSRRWAFFHGQQLCVLSKDDKGETQLSELLPVAFVPLIEGVVQDG
jgi:protein-L-isoaspartate(D-aspartate) O-methyltransferase